MHFHDVNAAEVNVKFSRNFRAIQKVGPADQHWHFKYIAEE